MTNFKKIIPLLLILVLGLVLRIYRITDNSLYGDELTLVYDSYSLLKTGHDSTGRFLPVTFEMGAGRPGGYVYGSIPFVAIFGPSALGVRGLSVLSGLGVIVLIYFLGKKLFDERTGVIASLITSVSMWDIGLSRGGFEAHFALFLALLGVVFFIYAKEKPIFLVFWALAWGLTLHTYPTYKLVLPIFLMLIFWFTNAKDWFFKQKFISSVGIIILFLFSTFSVKQTLHFGSEDRFLSQNVFALTELREELVQKINNERQLAEVPSGLTSIFHNKGFEYTRILTGSYLENFSPDFLFIKGDENPRHNMAEMGELYLVEAILLFLGFGYLWKKDVRTFKFITFWLLVAPLATTFLLDPHALRNAFMLPPLVFLSSQGTVFVLEQKNKIRWQFILLIILGFFIQLFFFLERTYFLAPNKFARFWSYPAKKASEIAIIDKGNYDYIFLSDQIDNVEFAYPVYARIDPKLVISQSKKRTELFGNKFKKFDNIYIGYLPDTEVSKFLGQLQGKKLYIENYTRNVSISGHETIDSPDLSYSLKVVRFE